MSIHPPTRWISSDGHCWVSMEGWAVSLGQQVLGAGAKAPVSLSFGSGFL